MTLTAVVLAAGEGKRMRSAVPKVLHHAVGRPLLGHVLAAVDTLQPDRVLVVVGHGRDEVTAWLREAHPAVQVVVQEEQRGTGHAVRTALDAVGEIDGTVFVVAGDTPLLRAETLRALVDGRGSAGAVVLAARLADPTGYGRVVRDDAGGVRAIVEERDATEAERAIDEVNSSVYAVAAGPLRAALAEIGTDNAQGEEYLTDVIGLLTAAGHGVLVHVTDDAAEIQGVNDRSQLAAAAADLRDRLVRDAQLAGVTIVDPATTWLDAGVVLEPDAVVEPFTILRGTTTVAAGATVGPYANLTDTEVGAGATVVASTCAGARIGPEARVGPYTYLRPGTVLGRGAKAGGFVEMKNAELADGAKVPHLSYIGDASIGERTNVGAGSITCNYDGDAKHRTEIGDDVFVGSGTMLVAPVTLGDGSYVAAGSAITENVPDGALAIGRARQVTKKGRAARSKAKHDDEGARE